MTDGHSFDPKLLMEHVGDDLELFDEMLEIFEANFPTTLLKLNEAIAQGQAGALKDLGHSIKGEMMTLGHQASVDHALELEKLGKSGITTGAEVIVVRLENSTQAIYEFIKEHRGKKK